MAENESICFLKITVKISVSFGNKQDKMYYVCYEFYNLYGNLSMIN